jgi:hypothetical protein
MRRMLLIAGHYRTGLAADAELPGYDLIEGGTMDRRHQTRTIGGAILVATGGVWVAQGTGLLRGSSFMTDDPLWILFGVLAIVFGIAFMWVGLRGRA